MTPVPHLGGPFLVLLQRETIQSFRYFSQKSWLSHATPLSRCNYTCYKLRLLLPSFNRMTINNNKKWQLLSILVSTCTYFSAKTTWAKHFSVINDFICNFLDILYSPDQYVARSNRTHFLKQLICYTRIRGNSAAIKFGVLL